MKRVFFLSLAFITLALILFSAFTKGSEVRERNEYEKLKAEITNAERQSRGQAVYFNRLSSTEQYLYDKIATAASELDKQTAKMPLTPSLEEIKNAAKALMLDDPSMFYIDPEAFSLDDIVIIVTEEATQPITEQVTQEPSYNEDDPPDVPVETDEVTQPITDDVTESAGDKTEIVKQVEQERYTTLVIPYIDTTENIERMRKRVNMALSQADIITANAQSEWEKAFVLHDHIAKISKKSSVGAYGNTAYGTLVECGGDSEGYALAYKLLLNRYDIVSYIVKGTCKGEGRYWTIALLDGKYYNIDTYGDDGGEVAIHAYFALGDTELSKTHASEDDSLPKCTINGDYYEKNALLCMSEDVFKNVVSENISKQNKRFEIKLGYTASVNELTELIQGLDERVDASIVQPLEGEKCYIVTLEYLLDETTENAAISDTPQTDAQ